MICFRKRFRISSAVDANEGLPDDLKAHLERCASCRRHYEQQREVAAMLEHPLDRGIEFPDRLNESIMGAIRQEPKPRKVRRGQDWNRSPWLAPVALASVALAAALILLLRDPEPDRPLLANGDFDSRDLAVSSFDAVPSDFLQTWSVAIDRPLDNELENVVADARTAVRFLAINFLPEDRAIKNL